MSVSLENFLPMVRPHITDCPEEIVLGSIRSACVRLCTDSWVIRENLPPSDIVVDVEDYTITASAGKAVVGMTSFFYKGRELARKTEEELNIIDSIWHTGVSGDATYVTAPAPNRILLNRRPEETTVGGMLVSIATKPLIDAEDVDIILLNDWNAGIKYGALQELYEIPGKSWTNLKQASWYGNKFNFEIQRAKARSQMGNMSKATMAKNRSWI